VAHQNKSGSPGKRPKSGKKGRGARRGLLFGNATAPPLVSDIIDGRGTDALLARAPLSTTQALAHPPAQKGRMNIYGGLVERGICASDGAEYFMQDVLIEEDSRIVVGVGSRVTMNDTMAATSKGTVAWAEHLEIAHHEAAGVASVSVSTKTSSVVTAVGSLLPSKRDEHQAFGDALARHLGKIDGVQYKAKPEESDGSGCDGDPMADVVLSADSRKLHVQVTHVWKRAARDLGAYSVVSEEKLTPATVQEAIDAKAAFAGKERVELLLICPVGLGRPMRAQLSQHSFDSQGYRRVWLCDLEFEPVELTKK
jgi:hypothetical protein